ncbi:nucleoside 2-deoxyribosyltransferase [Variovorax sp. J2P1-59]|uniref:nucleoside 2-deoxyribosyltransferase n=1 Tax=Variovorax flavidus TaxID=3053501 RepID=UPI00257907F3|nr:nucleoside 2-deoxyribosyltransferase [Variovorax sp. J2P1-59]MDM0073923.1 nucleoside 2-deoxyribosyltransferase [Variovorax sp. J2P1-59]
MSSSPSSISDHHRPRIYLAGPDVFFPGQENIFLALKAQCAQLGMEGLAPTDTALSPATHPQPDDLAQAIYEGNVEMIRQSAGVIANLVSFRGQEPDSGTVFEVGFAVALGKPVVGYGVPEGTYADRVSAAIACSADAVGEVREVETGAMVEAFGQPLNLMLARSIHLAPTARDALEWLAAELGAQTKRPSGI